MSVKLLLVKSIFSSWPSVHSGLARPAQPHRDTISASINNSKVQEDKVKEIKAAGVGEIGGGGERPGCLSSNGSGSVL